MYFKTFLVFTFLTTSLNLHTCDDTDHDAIIQAANREAYRFCFKADDHFTTRENALASAPEDARDAYMLGMFFGDKAFESLKYTHKDLTGEAAGAIFAAGMEAQRTATDLANTLITKKSSATIQFATQKTLKAAENAKKTTLSTFATLEHAVAAADKAK
jgi:hypothetical protein